MDILKKYHEEDGTPVKYGQCWVFSGVTTTGMCICRGLDIVSHCCAKIFITDTGQQEHGPGIRTLLSFLPKIP